MSPDKKAREELQPNTILQVNPKAEVAAGAGQLCAVVRVHSWGVDARLPSGDVVPLAWAHVEPTGGALVFDVDGTKLRATEPPLKHHP